MPPLWSEVLDRARDGLPALPPEARADAEALLRLCSGLALPGGSWGAGAPERAHGRAGEVQLLQRELARLVELLARRTSKAIPFATLGRAGLAHLSGALADRDALAAEADAKFAMLGL